MRRRKVHLWLLLLCLAGWSAGEARAQLPTASIGFRNETNLPVVVQGTSLVNGMPRRGQPILIVPGKLGWDNNLPPGDRLYTIYDATQPSKVLHRDFVVRIQGRDLVFSLRAHPLLPGRLLIVPVPVP